MHRIGERSFLCCLNASARADSKAWFNFLRCLEKLPQRYCLGCNPFYPHCRPLIKNDEAAWLCDHVRPGIEVITLTNLDRGR